MIVTQTNTGKLGIQELFFWIGGLKWDAKYLMLQFCKRKEVFRIYF